MDKKINIRTIVSDMFSYLSHKYPISNADKAQMQDILRELPSSRDGWLSVAYNPPPVGVWLLGQDKLGQVSVYSLVRHGRTNKLCWHDGTRYREEDTIVYWQLLPKPRKEASW